MITERKEFRSSYASVHLDLIRGLSALAVLFGHMRGLFFVDYVTLAAPSLIVRLFYFLAGFGHLAVMTFFVLSGYFISSSIFESCRAKRWSWNGYAINRASRLYTVLVPGLLWTIALDHLGMWLFPGHLVYRGLLAPNVVPGAVEARESAWVFFGNLGFLQNVIVTPLGSNGALWSLSNEFWYYAIFPLLAIPLLQRTRLGAAAASVGIGLILLCLVGPEHAFYFLIWLMGTGIALLAARYSRRRSAWTMVIASSLLFSAGLLGVRLGMLADPWTGDFLVGGGFGFLVLALLRCTAPCAWPFYQRIATWLASFSYSLYVFHLPLLVFLAACLLRTTRWEPSALHLTFGFLLMGITGLVAHMLSRATEARTDLARRFLLERLGALRRLGGTVTRPTRTLLPDETSRPRRASIVPEG
jgi:peptidoglycan/LPS O-acetylase OafA/YrhL